MRRLAGYVCGLALVILALELGCWHYRSLLEDSRHRALFKAALLDAQPPVQWLFFGTSRTGEAMRPSIISPRARKSVFNISVQYSCFEILDYLTARFAARPGLEHAFIEVSQSQLLRKALPWGGGPEASSSDFDGQVFAWLQAHSALAQERQSLVLESLSRFAAEMLFYKLFDGSEQFGNDYFLALIGHRNPQVDEADRRFFSPNILLPTRTEPLTVYENEAQGFATMAARFTKRGTGVTFVVPPTLGGSNPLEATESFQALLRRIADLAQVNVIDFTPAQPPAEFFRDPTHVSHEGGVLVSMVIASEVSSAVQ